MGTLSVRINDGSTDRHVTEYASGVKFSKAAPGGFLGASCNLNLPANTFTDLGPVDRVWFYDKRTGRTVWEGYTTNPGTQTGRGGQGFDLTALGPAALAADRRERLMFLDQGFGQWDQDWVVGQAPSATSQAGQFPDTAGTAAGRDGWMLQFNPGQPIDTDSQAGMRYRGFTGSPMTCGGIAFYRDSGVTDTNYKLEVIVPGTTVSQTSLSTTAARNGYFPGVTYTNLFPTAAASVGIKHVRRAGGATNIATDTFWSGVGELFVLGHLMDRNGTLLTMSTASHVTATSGTPVVAYVLASEVVEDLLGRILTFCDPVTAVVDTTTFQIDQLAYADATSAAQVLEDLAQMEPDFLYEFLESSSSGLHRFNWRAWPTSPRYIIPPSISVEQPGGDVDLCNRIAVNWTDAKGKPQVTVVTSTVAALGTRIRDADAITLPDGRGSAINAQRIGGQVLASKANPPKAANATIDRPIMDNLTGGLVYPWEIEPGYLVRVMATGDDLRLTEMEYEDDSQTATLTLGEPMLTLEQRVARLDKVKAA